MQLDGHPGPRTLSLHFRPTNVTFVACNSGCLFFLFLLFFMRCYHQHCMGVLGPFPTGREQNRADAEDLVEWCVCTRTWSVDVCMESNHENFPGTESSCPEKKPGKERNSYLCCETFSGFVIISPADSLLRNWQSLTARQLCLTALHICR